MRPIWEPTRYDVKEVLVLIISTDVLTLQSFVHGFVPLSYAATLVFPTVLTNFSQMTPSFHRVIHMSRFGLHRGPVLSLNLNPKPLTPKPLNSGHFRLRSSFGPLRMTMRAKLPNAIVKRVPGPQKYVKSWPLGLLLWVWGYYFTYFWGLGNGNHIEFHSPKPFQFFTSKFLFCLRNPTVPSY